MTRTRSGAVGGVEQQLGQGVHLLLGVEQKLADAQAERRAARLARGDDFASAQAQLAGEHAQLRGLAAPVDALEGDESGGQDLKFSVKVSRRAGRAQFSERPVDSPPES